MFRITMGGALQSQLDQIARVRSELPNVVRGALEEAGRVMVQDLASAAPRGTSGGGSALEGDASGPLAESFTESVDGSTLTVKTTQPTKLGYVTQGTGIYGPIGERIYPTIKKALYWPGADHPVRSVAGMEANDFVSPVTDGADEDINALVSEAIYEALQP